jgi:hypothetical protein
MGLDGRSSQKHKEHVRRKAESFVFVVLWGWVDGGCVELTNTRPLCTAGAIIVTRVRQCGAATGGRSRPQHMAAARGRRPGTDEDGSECGGRVGTWCSAI